MKFAVVALAGLGLASAVAQAQYDFEPPAYAGSAAGTPLTNGFGGGGQDGWFNPVTGSADHTVHTYAGNVHGFVQNPQGGEQFNVGRFGATHARAQHLQDFSSADLWTISYDVASIYLPGTAATNNIGSFSLQDSVTTQSYISLHRFNNLTTPTGWNIGYNVFDAAGAALATQEANANWQNLQFNHWYRQTARVDFLTHQITEIALTDLHSGIVLDVFNPGGWYLQGGAGSTLPRPDQYRIFNSGNAANIGGWDNISITPAPGGVLAFAGGLVLTLSRRRR